MIQNSFNSYKHRDFADAITIHHRHILDFWLNHVDRDHSNSIKSKDHLKMSHRLTFWTVPKMGRLRLSIWKAVIQWL